MMKEYWTIDEISEYLSVKRSSLYSRVEAKEIPYYRIGRLIRFKLAEVEEWMQANKANEVDSRRPKKISRSTPVRSRSDIDRVVKKTIEEVKNGCYTPNHGKPDRIKGLGKEVEHGSL